VVKKRCKRFDPLIMVNKSRILDLQTSNANETLRNGSEEPETAINRMPFAGSSLKSLKKISAAPPAGGRMTNGAFASSPQS
jgi:hypothetical protein